MGCGRGVVAAGAFVVVFLVVAAAGGAVQDTTSFYSKVFWGRTMSDMYFPGAQPLGYVLEDREFGRGVAPLGDVNGDGHNDIAISSLMSLAPSMQQEVTGYGLGLIYVFFGPYDPWDRRVYYTAADIVIGGRIGPIYQTNNEEYQFGSSLVTGDVTGDGNIDIITLSHGNPGNMISPSSMHKLFVIRTPFASRQNYVTPNDTNLVTVIVGNGAYYDNDTMRVNIPTFNEVTLEDLNGDGVLDMLLVMSEICPTGGDIFSHQGGAVFLPGPVPLGTFVMNCSKPGGWEVPYVSTNGQPAIFVDTFAKLNLTELGYRAEFGADVALGDINGDSFVDMAIGAPEVGCMTINSNETQDGCGMVFVYLTSGAPLFNSTEPTPSVVLRGIPATHHPYGSNATLRIDYPLNFGGVLAITDFDADGKADLFAGAPYYPEYQGIVMTYSGAQLTTMASQIPDATFNAPVFNSTEAIMVVVGDRYFSRIGSNMFPIGDINNDGKNDLVVSAPNVDSSYYGETNIGEVFLLLGASFSFTGGVVVDAETSARFPNAIVYGATPRSSQTIQHLRDYEEFIGASGVRTDDLDGDGLDEFATGEPRYLYGDGTPNGLTNALGSTEVWYTLYHTFTCIGVNCSSCIAPDVCGSCYTGWRGRHCELTNDTLALDAVLPGIVQYDGGSVTLVGRGFDATDLIYIAGIKVNGTLIDAQHMQVYAPQLPQPNPPAGTYQEIRMVRPFGKKIWEPETDYTIVRTNLLYYIAGLGCQTGGAQVVVNSIPTAGNWEVAEIDMPDIVAPLLAYDSWYYQGVCQPCPEGGVCPGGDRCWPKKGYWSQNENVPPVSCKAMETGCPGSIGEFPEYPSLFAVSGKRITARCANNSGYTGDYCEQCLPILYYKDPPYCRPCSADAQDVNTLIILIVVTILWFLVIATAIAVLRDKLLDSFVAVLITVQQLIILGRQAAPTPTLALVFQRMSVVVFEMEFFNPGCLVSKFPFAYIYAGTLGMMVIAAILFFFASLTRTLVAAYRAGKRPQWRAVFKRRFVRAYLILGCIVYLQVTIRSVQAVDCYRSASNPDVSVLVIEPTTECYSKAHMPVAIAAWIVLICFSGGFPLLCTYLVFRARNKGMLDAKRAEKFGFLYRGLRFQYFWFRLLTFVTNFALALSSVLLPSASVTRMYISGIFFDLNYVLIWTLLPYKVWWNVLGNGGAAAGSVLFFVIVMHTQCSAAPCPSGATGGAIAIFVLSTIFIIIVLLIRLRRKIDEVSVRAVKEYLQELFKTEGESDSGTEDDTFVTGSFDLGPTDVTLSMPPSLNDDPALGIGMDVLNPIFPASGSLQNQAPIGVNLQSFGAGDRLSTGSSDDSIGPPASVLSIPSMPTPPPVLDGQQSTRISLYVPAGGDLPTPPPPLEPPPASTTTTTTTTTTDLPPPLPAIAPPPLPPPSPRVSYVKEDPPMPDPPAPVVDKRSSLISVKESSTSESGPGTTSSMDSL